MRSILQPYAFKITLQELGFFLAGASALRSLGLRWATFVMTMERLRLGPAGYEALILGLCSVVQHRSSLSLLLLLSLSLSSTRSRRPCVAALRTALHSFTIKQM